MTVQTPAASAPVLAEPAPEPRSGDLVAELVDSLRPRLSDSLADSLPAQVQAALEELGEVRVTTYLPILIERRLRDGHFASAPAS